MMRCSMVNANADQGSVAEGKNLATRAEPAVESVDTEEKRGTVVCRGRGKGVDL